MTNSLQRSMNETLPTITLLDHHGLPQEHMYMYRESEREPHHENCLHFVSAKILGGQELGHKCVGGQGVIARFDMSYRGF